MDLIIYILKYLEKYDKKNDEYIIVDGFHRYRCAKEYFNLEDISKKYNRILEILKSTVVLTAGTCLLLWIGDQITKKGIGNGLSLMIMAGIIQSLPSVFLTAFNELVLGETFSKGLGAVLFGSFIIIYLLIIIGMVWIQLAERRIPIQYANRTNSAYGGHQNFLPIKINSAGVMPVIFASALLSIPQILASVFKKEGFTL